MPRTGLRTSSSAASSTRDVGSDMGHGASVSSIVLGPPGTSGGPFAALRVASTFSGDPELPQAVSPTNTNVRAPPVPLGLQGGG